MNEIIDNREDWEKGPFGLTDNQPYTFLPLHTSFKPKRCRKTENDLLIDKMLAERSSAIQVPRFLFPAFQNEIEAQSFADAFNSPFPSSYLEYRGEIIPMPIGPEAIYDVSEMD